jgi:hypothetical protein
LGAIDLDMIVDFARLRTAGDFVGLQATTTSFEEILEAIERLINCVRREHCLALLPIGARHRVGVAVDKVLDFEPIQPFA